MATVVSVHRIATTTGPLLTSCVSKVDIGLHEVFYCELIIKILVRYLFLCPDSITGSHLLARGVHINTPMINHLVVIRFVLHAIRSVHAVQLDRLTAQKCKSAVRIPNELSETKGRSTMGSILISPCRHN
jgi:hypothetical protein